MEKLHKIIAEVLGVVRDDISAEKDLGMDLGADSLDMIEMLMVVEMAFDVEVPDDVAEKWHTVGDVEEHLRNV
jgi:acyl carrier protein